MTGVLKENIISVFLLQIFMFDSMCSLSLVVKFTIYIHINLQYLSENCFHNKFISVCCFLKVYASVYCHFMEKSSVKIVLNISFCVQQEERHESE